MNKTQIKSKAKITRLLASNNSSEKSSYKQELIKYDIKIKNFDGKSQYGYNEKYDFVCISKSGLVGEVVEVQGLKIGLPKAPKDVFLSDKPKEEQYWVRPPKPTNLKKIKNVLDFMAQDEAVISKYNIYITEELRRRREGFWFMVNGKHKYITGSHYMFLQWSKIDSDDGSGHAGYREPNTIFYYFWEACVADSRSYGMCYLKNRRSGFSTIASSELVNEATLTKRARFGILSKSGADAKKMFTDKVVPISLNYPFFFKPIQSGEERPKSMLEYSIPSERLSKKKLRQVKVEEDYFGEGLNTSIDWKNTGNNSYDGEKLKILAHDESGKWERPESIKENWRVTKTCLRLGRKVVGKCMMGSTANSLAKGGGQFKEIYDNSNLTKVKRNNNGQTSTGLYSLFINAYWNMEGFFDKYGMPIFEVGEKYVMNSEGDVIKDGSIKYWENEIEGYNSVSDQDGLNEYYRQFPATESHAFRDEAKDSLFNLSRIYTQIDYNDGVKRDGIVRTGSFYWENGDIHGKVQWRDDRNGRFRVIDKAIIPNSLSNKKELIRGLWKPSNADLGAFGCDSYDISGTVGGGGSNGALHGVTGFHMNSLMPTDTFFLEYIARPQTAAIFYEEVLMACIYYGMPILVENNKPGILYHFARRGFRGYSMNRPDKRPRDLSVGEREIGGIPSSPSVIQSHASAIEAYIEDYVGQLEDGTMGEMYFDKTLNDWARYDITKRTLFDASISSGFALMAVRKHLYKPEIKIKKEPISLNFGKNMKRNNW